MTKSTNHGHGADDAVNLDATGEVVPDLSGAYSELIRGLKIWDTSSDQMKELSSNFAAAAGLDKIAPQDIFGGASRFIPPTLLSVPEPDYELPEAFVDPTPRVIAENTERMAGHAERQAQAVDELVRLTASTLALATEQREQAERSERFAERMSWASVVIAGASLAAAVAAIVVSIVVAQAS